MRILFTTLSCVFLSAGLSFADVYRDLYNAMFMDEIAEVMHIEGLEYVDSIGESYLEGRNLSKFQDQSKELYDLETLKAGLLEGLEQELSAELAQQTLDYYQTETGQLAARLEATARRAISDDTVEEMAKSMVLSASETDGDRIEKLLAFIDELELVQNNLEGSFKSQFLFLNELAGIKQLGLTEQDILTLLSESKAETEASIKEWLIAFTYMAYQPLNDDQFVDYLDMQTSDMGIKLNDALFAVFHGLDQEISVKLGVIVRTLLSAQDL